MPRLRSLLATGAAGVLAAVLGLADPAAAVTLDQKLAVLSSWTQTTADSQGTWLSARANQGAWTGYAFDWSTDYCSSSPDNPLGFDFTLSCARHDFGYRNYKAVEEFPANKPRVDSAFYEDLKRRCATYSSSVRPACTALAWTYYQAVKAFGSVTPADVDRAAVLMK
jgi:Prokaryotic phospholipase A2